MILPGSLRSPPQAGVPPAPKYYRRVSEQVEQREFQAEARQLLQLMVHSIYSNKDSFLRELISNASDALDKLRLEAFLDKDLVVDTSDLHIEVDADKTSRTLTIRDNGIGMTRDEVVELIGTLAKSGTAELREKLSEAKHGDAEALIGQFGIGFYSTFMVADAVELLTRKAGESSATRWESSGDGTYVIATVDDAPQGTSVTLHLKPEDADDELHDYTAPWKIRELVKKYSDFISWPIRMEVEKTTPAAEDGGEPTVTVETETINSRTALWAKPKAEVTDEEYAQFYKHVAHAWDEPLEVIAMKAEGTFEYQALLFIPSQAPFDLFNRDGHTGVQLYVKRVFIMGDCDELVPEYLRFVKGVVDAQDMSLNVSREILQQDRQIKIIRRSLTKKVLSAIKDLQSDRPHDYATFWTQFGRVFKEGLLSDVDNRDTVLKLSSFASTFTGSSGATGGDTAGAPTTLADYVGRMKDGQEQIFYATGESRQLLERSPHLEAFAAKGYEVLLLTDPVDEVWVESVPEFDGKTLQSVAKGEVDLGASEDGDDDPAKGDFAELLTWLQETLDEHVKEVRLSTRLTSSPACLITDTFGITPQLARMYRASGQEVPVGKRILELNPGHPLVTGMATGNGRDRATGWLGRDGRIAVWDRPSRRGRRTRRSGAFCSPARRPVGADRLERGSGPDVWKAYLRRSTNTVHYGAELPLAQGVQFGQHLGRVGTQLGCRPGHLARRTRKPGGHTGEADRTVFRIHRLEEADGVEVRVVEEFGRRLNGRGGNLELAEQLQPLGGGPLQQCLRDQSVHDVDLLGALLEGRVRLVIPGGLHRIDERVPVLVVVDQHRDVAVLRLVRLAVRRHRPRVDRRAQRGREHGAIGVLDEHEGRHRLEHADLHLLPVAGTFAVEQRHHRGVERGQSGDLVRHDRSDVGRLTGEEFLDGRKAGLGLNGVVVGGTVGFGSAPAVAVAVRVDDGRIDGGDVVVGEPQLGDRPGPHRMDEDIRLGD